MSRRKDRERAKTHLFRDGKLVPVAEVEKPKMSASQAVAEVVKEAGIPGLSDRLAKLRTQIKS